MLVLFVVYVAIAVERERVMGRPELFPFASWSLFSKVPNELRSYSLLLESLGDRVPPTLLEQTASLLPSPSDRDTYVAIQALGSAIERGDKDDETSARLQLEQGFLDGQPVRYQVIVREYDPLELWNGRGFRSVRILRAPRTRDP